MRIPLSKLATTLSELTTTESFALLSVAPVYEYEAGKKTEKVIATRYSVADPETFDKFDVKVMNTKAIITKELLESNSSHIWVEFSGAMVKPYKVEFGSALCSVTADDVKLVKD